MRNKLWKTIAAVTATGMLMGGTPVIAQESQEDFVIMWANADEAFAEVVIDKIQEAYPQYHIISKQWSDATDTNQTVKSTFATDNEALDIVMYNNSLSSYVQNDMALDLTPYLDTDPEFKARFVEGALEGATNCIDGKVYGLPYSIVYPMMEVNTEILEKAGVEVKTAWTWDEFIDACKKVAENTDAYPIGCQSAWGPWFAIEAAIQAFDTEEEYLDFCLGGVSFTDERIITNLNKVVDLYNNYAYPGAGAISASAEEVDTAFANGKIAMRFDVNSMSQNFLAESGLDTSKIKICSWPTMAAEGAGSAGDRLLGGNNMFFIPSNSKHVDAAWDILKYIFSDEIQKTLQEYGVVTCVNMGTEGEKNVFAQDASKLASDLIYSHDSEMLTYFGVGEFFGDYIYDPDLAIETIEDIREGMVE